MELVLMQSQQETPDTWTLRFKPNLCLDFIPGQYLLFDIEVKRNSVQKTVRRAFSISSPPNKAGWVEITVKRYEPGMVSPILCGLRPGAKLQALGPMGRFQWDPNAKELVLIGGGTGIAPLRAILHVALEAKQKVTLLYSVKRPEDFIFGAELKKLAKQYPRFVFVPTITKSDGVKGWSGYTDRIDETMIKARVKDLTKPLFYLCGSLSFVRDIETQLLHLSVLPRQIKKEIFG